LAYKATIFASENKKQENMAVHVFKRYVWLLDLISQGGKTYEDIDRAWRNNYLLNNNKEFLPKRTLHNHITAIKEMFVIEIECRKQLDIHSFSIVGLAYNPYFA
jgi:hypothetical protein